MEPTKTTTNAITNDTTYTTYTTYTKMDKNLCVECGIDIGYQNPRQYCGKTHCLYVNYK